MILGSQTRRRGDNATSSSQPKQQRSATPEEEAQLEHWRRFTPPTRPPVASRHTKPENSFYRQQSETNEWRRAQEEARRRQDQEHEHQDEDQDQENDWRRDAQMLTEHDEMRLLLSDSGRRPIGADVLDVAPVNRRLLRPKSPAAAATAATVQPQQVARGQHKHRKMAVFTASPSPTRMRAAKTGQRAASREHDHGEADEEVELPMEELDEDDNSSISFAQSGCHSILSAWRVKAANRAARLTAAAARPVSVLSAVSGATAATATGKSPASQTRIPLGPKSAQHFVTNTRRRRRANELILTTLEARRRALNLNRQNVASLLGCESFVETQDGVNLGQTTRNNMLLLDPDYQRLSLSPSPLGRPLSGVNKSPSPQQLAMGDRQQAARTTLSDLGAPQTARDHRNGRAMSPSAVQAQRQRLLLAASLNKINNNKGGNKTHRKSSKKQPPPIDQNSSDLASNSSLSSGDDDESSSSGSQFTQLVTSELAAADCELLDEQLHRRQQQAELQARLSHEQSESSRAASANSTTSKPPVPARPSLLGAQRVQQTTKSSSGNNKEIVYEDRDESEQQKRDHLTSSFRRGALKRDSIRRLRLSKTITTDSTSSSDNQQQKQRQTASSLERTSRPEPKAKPTTKARKLDTDNNKSLFLDRTQARSMSTRSSSSEAPFRRRLNLDERPPPANGHQSRPDTHTTQHKRSPTPVQRLSRAASSHSPAESPAQQRPTRYQIGGETFHKSQKREQTAPTDQEDVRKVEQMLRQMKSGDSFRSSSRENLTSSSSSQQKQQFDNRSKLNSGELFASSTGKQLVPLPPQPPRRNRTSAEREIQEQQLRSQHQSNSGAPTNEFKAITRLVREGSRSRDDLKFDSHGNRRQMELEERWRHEQSDPIRLADGTIFSERKYLDERVEVQRISSSSMEKLNPPLGFADESRSQSPVKSRKPPEQPAPRKPPRSADPTIRQMSTKETSASTGNSERPIPRAQTRNLFGENQSKLQEYAKTNRAPNDALRSPQKVDIDNQEKRQINSYLLKKHQDQLPKLERSADDEFRKRVDQLRRMARANLDPDDSQTKELEQRARRARLQQTVKPLSTNWSGPEVDKRPTGESESPTSFKLTGSSEWTGGARNRVASTNLDDMLLADRYQKPLPLGSWRRSNSSLASLGGPSRVATRQLQQQQQQKQHNKQQQQQQQQKVHSDATRPKIGLEQSFSSQSELSAGQRSSESMPSPMRLVVREKTEPTLGVASLVEQPQLGARTTRGDPPNWRPASGAGQATSDSTGAALRGRVMAGGVTTRSKSPAPNRPQSPAHQPNGGAPIRAPKEQHQQLQQRGSPLKPQRLRSPEPSAQAASSSNDDSAITSSVSSPSLSFTLAANQQAASAAQPRVQQFHAAAAANQRAHNQTRPEHLTLSSQPMSGALQSILRRQQQQLQLQQQLQAQQTSFDGLSPNAEQRQQQQAATDQLRRPTSPSILRPTSPLQQRDGSHSASGSQLQSGQPKRVHFNERASIRSFESISSQADSGTTAVAADEHGSRSQAGAFGRRLGGSPDSMGSASSTSRLSGDSPDSFGRSLALQRLQQQQQQQSGGAAIYAIRGDPELEPAGELDEQPQLEPQLQPQRPQVAGPLMGHQTRERPFAINEAQMGRHQVPATLGQSRPPLQRHQVLAESGGQTAGAQFGQLQTGLGQSGHSIQMTAPPTISANNNLANISPLVSPQRTQQQQQQFVQHHPQRYVAPESGPLGVQQLARQPGQRAPLPLDDDDEDYASRLRQAATSRALFSAFAQHQHQQQQQQQLSPQPQTISSGAGPLQPPGATSGRTGGHNSMVAPQLQQQQSRRTKDLRNFQTEV